MSGPAEDATPEHPAEAAALGRVLADTPPFDAVTASVRDDMVRSARIERFGPGELIIDAFIHVGVEVFVVMAGRVDLWHDADRIRDTADERLGQGGVFGFSAMLSERSIGPRVVAVESTTVAAIPAAAVEPVFASRRGARFLAAQGAVARGRVALTSYSLVDELIGADPLVVDPGDTVADVAAAMTRRDVGFAVVPMPDGHFGLVTDAMLRRRVLVEGREASIPARKVMDASVPTVTLGDSAAEALILMLDRNAEYLVVTDRSGRLRGVITPRDFTISAATAGVSVHEQIRRASTVEELHRRARRVPAMLSDLLSAGLASAKVIAVYSTILDTIVRRAMNLIFAQHPDLSLDAFTWLSLGSNGRREAVLSSDVDSAVAFVDALEKTMGPPVIVRYRAAFAEVDSVLTAAGLTGDAHGATAGHPAFSRSNAAWHAAALQWMAEPEKDQGAIMTSLLVDGRPIHGDPGLPEVSKVFGDLRRHPGTMRMLLSESLSARAKSRSLRDVLARRDTVDLKEHALLPIVNTARWAALAVGSAALSTTERLQAAAGSAMLPDEQAHNLIDVFAVLQRLRLRYQLIQHQRGEPPTDVITRDRLSPIDRSVVAQAIREIAGVQRRMDNIAAYLPAEAWTSRAPT
jgi:CBS domain-containing protein